MDWLTANSAVVIAAILTSLTSLALGLNNRKKNNADAAKSLAEATSTLVPPLRSEIEQLRKDLKATTCNARINEKRIEKLEDRVLELEKENAELRRGVKLLVKQICEFGQTPVWDWPTSDK